MKRLILLPTLVLGLSFACDQPHEEVVGIKIGCPYEGDLSLGYKDKENEQVMIYSKRLNGGFFREVQIKVIDGNVEGLSFVEFSKDHDDIKRSGDALFKSLSDKWGEPEIVDTLDIESVRTFGNFNDSILNEIIAVRMVMKPVSRLNLTYTSKKMDEALKSEKNERYQQFKSL